MWMLINDGAPLMLPSEMKEACAPVPTTRDPCRCHVLIWPIVEPVCVVHMRVQAPESCVQPEHVAALPQVTTMSSTAAIAVSSSQGACVCSPVRPSTMVLPTSSCAP